jgi:hypothetical protein
MTQIRKWLLTAAVVLALALPLGAIASADGFDGGFGGGTGSNPPCLPGALCP